MADAAIDYGRYLLVFEVTGGQPVVDTRVSGDSDSFERDTNKLVLEEAEQLDAICRSLRNDEKALTGCSAPPYRRLVPIVVPAGGYPSDALARSHVDDIVAEKGWLQDLELEPLCVLDLSEVEILESLHEAHLNPGEILAHWKRSGLRNVGFKNFVQSRSEPEPAHLFAN